MFYQEYRSMFWNYRRSMRANSPFWIRCCCEVVNARQERIFGQYRHHASCRHEHTFHINTTFFVSKNSHHCLSCDVAWKHISSITCLKWFRSTLFSLLSFSSTLVNIYFVKLSDRIWQLTLSYTDLDSFFYTLILFQQPASLAVAPPSGFHPCCVHERVNLCKTEPHLAVPPAFLLCILPHSWVFLVYLCSDGILVGNVPTSTLTAAKQKIYQINLDNKWMQLYILAVNVKNKNVTRSNHSESCTPDALPATTF